MPTKDAKKRMGKKTRVLLRRAGNKSFHLQEIKMGVDKFGKQATVAAGNWVLKLVLHARKTRRHAHKPNCQEAGGAGKSGRKLAR